MQINSGMEELWKSSTDIENLKAMGLQGELEFPWEYYADLITFAISWAERMEAGINLGLPLADIWKGTEKGAENYHELSGNSYNLAVQLLVWGWVHGEELRRLHNATFGYDGEGTVNGTIMIVGGEMREEPR